MSESNHNEMPKEYDPQKAETYWYAKWNEAGVFTPDPKATLDEGKKPYVIMMPPPNVTGTLHCGHALFVTLQDMLARYHRMEGHNTLWLPGVDHAGIATQSVVERQLKKNEGKTRHDLGREEFLKRVWQWKEENGSRIVEQLKVLGASADWSRERFTMDDECSASVKEAFVRMWDDDLIYRGERLVNWDPATQTALSNEEVDHVEKDGALWEFAYRLKEGAKSAHSVEIQGTSHTYMVHEGDEIVVATTRPETMLGDTAVAVHPDDERYKAWVGKKLAHPFFPERVVTIVADAHVDPEFGTGAVKITPAHDPNDFEIGQRHELEMINILDEDASINEKGGPFAGLDRYDARKSVKAALDGLGLARGSKSIKHQVSVSERSGVAIEPMLSRQYFVKAGPLAEKACAAVDSGETRIIPSGWTKTWDHFMKNIRDWCISRQLWWGHRIPVFYDLTKVDEAIESDANRKGGDTAATRAQADGKSARELVRIALRTVDDDLVKYFTKASVEELEKNDPERWMQEEDVLDTWFSSGLWPFSTLGWPGKTDDLDAFYPGAVLETGFDILFFWVARMMMMGCYFMDKAPFSDVYLHAMVRDANGKKMSKSLGNAVDPLDVIRGISLEDLLTKTKSFPVPEKLLPKVLKGLEKDFPKGIPASGADGLRFSLAALAGPGRDVKLAIPRVNGYRAFLNKIWNATRFATMRIGTDPVDGLAPGGQREAMREKFSVPDRWILSRLQAVVEKSHKAIADYRFDEAANAIYHFFWTEFCDHYIEFSKGPLSDEEDSDRRRATRAVLIHVLDTSMRLLHPLCPFQSEEIFQRLPGRKARWPDTEFCATAPYPHVEADFVSTEAEAEFELLTNCVQMARNARQESGLSVDKSVDGIFIVKDESDRKVLEAYGDEVQRLARLSKMTVSSEATNVPKLSAINADGRVEVIVPLEGLIEEDALRSRLEKSLKKIEKEKNNLEKRLANPKFLEKAPAEVLAQLKSDVENAVQTFERLSAARDRLNA